MRLARHSFPLIAVLGCVLGGAVSCTSGSDVSRQLGARCEVHDECDDVCLPDPEFPDGFCSINCNGPAACPTRSLCVDVAQGVCLYRCSEPGDCDFLGSGWRCARMTALSGDPVEVCTGP